MIRKITIRPMRLSDAPALNKWFGANSIYKKKPGHWAKYIKEDRAGQRVVVVAEVVSRPVGYCTLKFKSGYDFFRRHHIPEINDMIVASQFRNKGIGQQLVAYLEKAARRRGYKQIGIGVGLYADYGPAQRLYVKMGYVPDGRGVTYKDVMAKPGEKYRLDDDLILYFTKTL